MWERICDPRFVLGLVLSTVVFATPAVAQSLPDPTERTSMQRSGTGPAAPTAWVLQSTLIAEDRRVAVINGESVTVGDRVHGAVVLGIEPFAVRLRAADGILVITLTDGDPKRFTSGGME